jgi:ribosome-associated translation inhibitor RaiA
MRIEVSGHELEGRPGLQTYVEQRLVSILGHLTRHVDCVTLRGETVDLRPLKGAFRCQILARLALGRELVEEEVDADLCAAIDRAAEALARDVEYVTSRLPPGGNLRCA